MPDFYTLYLSWKVPCFSKTYLTLSPGRGRNDNYKICLLIFRMFPFAFHVISQGGKEKKKKKEDSTHSSILAKYSARSDRELRVLKALNTRKELTMKMHVYFHWWNHRESCTIPVRGICWLDSWLWTLGYNFSTDMKK